MMVKFHISSSVRIELQALPRSKDSREDELCTLNVTRCGKQEHRFLFGFFASFFGLSQRDESNQRRNKQPGAGLSVENNRSRCKASKCGCLCDGQGCISNPDTKLHKGGANI